MQRDTGPDPSIDLREYLGVLWHRKWSIALVTLLVVGSALAFSLRQTPMYTSRTRVLVRANSVTVGVAPAPVNLDTERALVDSAAVASIVQQDLGLPGSVDALLTHLSVSVEANTEILTIAYSDPSALRAQLLAKGFGEGYLKFREQQAQSQIDSQMAAIQNTIDQVQSQITSLDHQIAATTDAQKQSELSGERDSAVARLGVLQQQLEGVRALSATQGGSEIVQPANLPTAPSSPSYPRNLALALVVGLLLGVGLAFLRERLDDRVRNRQDFEEQLQAPVLAAIPKVEGWRKRSLPELVTTSAPKSASAEAYRTLRTNLHFIARNDDFKVLVVTSAGAGEGKTTTVANLAVALAQADTKVVAVSCDLRKPRLEGFFDLSHEPGVTTVLVGDISTTDAMIATNIPNLRIISSGPVPPNPSELLSSAEFEMMLVSLRKTADFVLVDAPPLLAVTDALEMATKADGVLLVSDPAVSSRAMVEQARQQLAQVGANLVGGVMNNLAATRFSYYPYYHASYRQGAPYDDGDGRGLIGRLRQFGSAGRKSGR